MNTKKTKIVEINEHDKIVEILNKNHIRFYNSEKKNWFIQNKKQKFDQILKINEKNWKFEKRFCDITQFYENNDEI